MASPTFLRATAATVAAFAIVLGAGTAAAANGGDGGVDLSSYRVTPGGQVTVLGSGWSTEWLENDPEGVTVISLQQSVVPLSSGGVIGGNTTVLERTTTASDSAWT